MAKKEVFEDQIDLIKKVKDRKKKIEKEIEKDAIQQTVSRQMSLITDNANVYQHIPLNIKIMLIFPQPNQIENQKFQVNLKEKRNAEKKEKINDNLQEVMDERAKKGVEKHLNTQIEVNSSSLKSSVDMRWFVIGKLLLLK